MRAAREQAVARRKDALTGTSDFPDLAEAPVAVLDVPRVASTPYPSVLKFDPLPPMRLAEPFERLRDASDRLLAQTGARPKIFLANLGKPADFTARAAFAKNFFEAGGIEAVSNDGFASRDDMLAALRSLRRQACLPVLLRRGLCARGGCRRQVAGSGGRSRLSRRPAGRARAGAAGGRDRPISSSPVAMRSPRCGPPTASLPGDRKAIRLPSSSAFPSP